MAWDIANDGPFNEPTLRTVAGQQGAMDAVARLSVYRSASCNGRKLGTIKGFDALVASLDVGEHPLYASPQPALAVKGLHGPHGWLNGHRALSEDSWTLESDPLENSEEYFAIPLYALVDPFKEIGKDWDGGPALAGEVGTYSQEASDRAVDRLDATLFYDQEYGGVTNLTNCVDAVAESLGLRRSGTSALVASPQPAGVVDWRDLCKRLLEALCAELRTNRAIHQNLISEANAALTAIAPATADGWRLVPYLWQCKDYADGWLSYANEDEAQAYQRDTGCAVRITYRPLPTAPTAMGGR